MYGDGLQDLQADSLKKEIEKLRQTVGSSAAGDSDSASDNEGGALHVDYGESEQEDAVGDAGNIRIVCP